MAGSPIKRRRRAGELAPAAANPTAHGPDCSCVRCTGNLGEHTTTHGSYQGAVQLAPRAAEIADVIVLELQAEGLWRPLFGPAVGAAATALVRVERAEKALRAAEDALADGQASPDGAAPLARLEQDARGWANTARGYLNDLGLTPRALAQIARDTGLAQSARSVAALQALGEHLEREHGTGGGR
jgi:hypothetical protein